MKRLKKLLPTLFLGVLALAMIFAVACAPVDPGPEEEPPKAELLSVEVNADNARQEFLRDIDEFTPAGIVVTATIKDVDGSTKTENVTNEATVDSSAFNKAKEGEYQIVVSYTLEGKTESDSYTVKVFAPREGMFVSFVSDGSQAMTIYLGEATTTAIDIGMIKVQRTNERGEVTEEITGFTYELYNGNVKVENMSGVPAGTYNLWCYKPSEIHDGYTLSGFVIIHVVAGSAPAAA